MIKLPKVVKYQEERTLLGTKQMYRRPCQARVGLKWKTQLSKSGSWFHSLETTPLISADDLLGSRKAWKIQTSYFDMLIKRVSGTLNINNMLSWNDSWQLFGYKMSCEVWTRRNHQLSIYAICGSQFMQKYVLKELEFTSPNLRCTQINLYPNSWYATLEETHCWDLCMDYEDKQTLTEHQITHSETNVHQLYPAFEQLSGMSGLDPGWNVRRSVCLAGHHRPCTCPYS